ncbi:MAG: tyrosine-type recombinase/integrase [Candidatus Jordarchaeales archaeon]
MVSCPYCYSTRIFKSGFRVTRTGKRVQRYLCRSCLHKFSLPRDPEVEVNVSRKLSEPSKPIEDLGDLDGLNPLAPEPGLKDFTLPPAEYSGVHAIPKFGKALYSLYLEARDSREEESGSNPPADEPEMNLAGDEAMSVLVQQPGAAQGKARELEGILISFAWWLKKQGRSEATVRDYCKMLRLLVKHNANLDDPESVKEALARLNKSSRWKNLAVFAYGAYLRMNGKHWDPPSVNITRKLPFIPLESELDALIACCGPKTAAFLQLLKETGLRVGEALRLKWSDVDLERRVIIFNESEKNGNPRIFRISDRLITMLNMLPKKNERVFPTCYNSIEHTFKKSREKLAKKLNNPRLLNITFHSFRHWKATMEYHKTKDILHVRELLGHKNIEDTMLYIQVEKTLFGEENSEFTVKVAKDPKEIQSLLEVGFEYVCEKDGLMFFRKRK